MTSSFSSLEERTIALAGIMQHCELVNKLAHNGTIDQDALEIAVKAILNTEPEGTSDVFRGITGVRSGLELINQQLENKNKQRENDITRYSITVLFLASKLLKNSAMLKKLSDGIDKARSQAEHFGFLHNNIFASLGGLYSETISHINPRIMVTGEPVYLENPETANRIRTLLLAAIRSAVLWQQLGGSRWQLLFSRKKIINTANQLCKNT